MVFNPQYDLARPLASALKAKAPIVGIPIPGHAPLIFNRLFLVRALKGVLPVNIEVEVLDSGERLLIVDGRAGESNRGWSVKHHMRVRSLHRGRWQDKKTIEDAMAKWKPADPKAPKTSKYDKALAKLYKQVANLRDKPTIQNPCTYDNRYEPSECERESVTREWTRWRNQKALRGKVGALARAAKTSRDLYAGLRALGLANVRTFSELHTEEKRSLATRSDFERERGYTPDGTFFDFADPKNLWRFQPDLRANYRPYTFRGGRPSIYGTDGNDLECWGPARYETILEWSRARRELESQILGIKDMAL